MEDDHQEFAEPALKDLAAVTTTPESRDGDLGLCASLAIDVGGSLKGQVTVLPHAK